MKNIGIQLAVWSFMQLCVHAQDPVLNPQLLMPQQKDETQIWWTDGFPNLHPGASWERQIETGYYRFAFNTQTLGIRELGAKGESAKLELQITKDGKTYTATEGCKWSKHSGPRLIESGKFFQRIDVTDLVFKSADGETLDPNARIEIAAWPDRLAFIFSAEGGALRIRLKQGGQGGKTITQNSPSGEVALAFDPVTFRRVRNSPVKVSTNKIRVIYDPALGWHRINLDKNKRIGKGNDIIEKTPFTLNNPTDQEQVVRLMFEKTAGGFRGRTGFAITGVSAILRDENGNPTGIPVQLSKNWHQEKEAGVYRGQWFHGITQVRLPAKSKVNLELVLANGHWGGVAAASHAQLCLIGWGGNSLWEQSALGSWGESICYDPDQALARSAITDMRPLMVRGMNHQDRWGWTANMGGGDFFRFFDAKGKQVAYSEMRTTYHKYGPCLTEVTYAGKVTDAIKHQMTVSLGRTDDLVRGIYRIRMDVEKPIDFSRFVIFQIGSDTYNFTTERKIALGNTEGLSKEWATQWGGNVYRTEPIELKGAMPWVSLHEGVTNERAKGGAIANRGFVIREWKARLGGKDASPYVAERGLTRHKNDSSLIDLLPPPGVTRLKKGDFIEATIEHLIIPQSAEDYYGPNDALRKALAKDGNTWKMVKREAAGNKREVNMKAGKLLRKFPDIRIQSSNEAASFTVKGGLGFVPVTFTGLKSPTGHILKINGKAVNQGVHGNDFWQTDFDSESQTWSQTYNLPLEGSRSFRVQFESKK